MNTEQKPATGPTNISDAESTTATPQPTPGLKRKRLLLIALIAILVLAAGAAAWLFLKPDKKPAPADNKKDNIVTTPTTPEDPTALYLSLRRDDSTKDYYMLDAKAAQSKHLYKVARGESGPSVTLKDGTVRHLVTYDTQKSASDSTYTIAVQDNDKEPKIIAEFTAQAGANVSRTYWSDMLNHDGSKAYFYERDNLKHTRRIASVDMQGTIETVTDFSTLDAASLRVTRSLVPAAISKDNQTLYLRQIAINTDSPSPGDIIAYDIPTKKFRHIFEDPVKHMNYPNKDKGFGYGHWEPLNDTYAYVFTSTRANMFFAESYEEIGQANDWLYLVNLKTGASTEVFKTAGEDVKVSPLQASADGKTFYFYTERATKLAAHQYADIPGHAYALATNKYFAYDIAANKAAIIPFDIDDTKTTPAFLTSTNGTYVLGLGYRQSLMQTSDEDNRPHPTYVYTAPIAHPANKKQIFESPAERYSKLSLERFKAQQ